MTKKCAELSAVAGISSLWVPRANVFRYSPSLRKIPYVRNGHHLSRLTVSGGRYEFLFPSERLVLFKTKIAAW
jgi:hypothetical protein